MSTIMVDQNVAGFHLFHQLAMFACQCPDQQCLLQQSEQIVGMYKYRMCILCACLLG